MAQDAELKLKVSLDLAYFRQRISTISTELAGQAVQLNVQFNKKSIADQYRLLNTYIGRKTFKVKVESNTLDTLVEKVAKFKENLQKLEKESVKLNVEIESKIKGQDAADARRNLIASITGQKGAVFIPIEVKPPLTKNINAIRKDIKDRLSGIVVEIEAKLKGAAGLGQATGGASKEAAGKRPSFLDSPAYQAELQKIAKANAQSLAKAAATLPSGRNRQEVERLLQAFQAQNPQGASRSSALGAIRELIARGRYQQGLGFEASLQPIRGQRQTSAPRSMPNLNQMLDRIANLTENPRAAQRMLRMMPESRLTTDLIGAANRQAAFREQYGAQGFRTAGFNAPRAFDPLLKAIAKDFSDYAKTVNISDPWVGKIGDGIRRIVSVSAQSAAATTKALPPIGGTTSPMSALESRLAQSRGILGTGGGAAASLFAGRGLINPGVSMPSPVGIAGPYRQMAAALASRAADPALAHRQIADIGFGAVPTAATGMSGQALNQALNQAFLQRRGLAVGAGQALPIFNAPGVAVQQNIPGMAYRMGGGGLGGAMPPGGGGGSGGGFGGMGGLGGFGRAISSINLPGAGTIRELGSEFAFATKQVLLFGQAYKLLGFFQDLPGQVSDAVSKLQSFRNTLDAVTPSAEEARASNEAILDLVEKYNVPLQSAREGFTKLYASMEPAGFNGDQIRGLFTGITKAAATFGMSADKVDRVNYAFAQMASKGQVMSEELKGQLGDVLPGAMAIFAQAAGFKGPNAIAEFSKALEDGRYKGEAMVALLNNVSIVLNTKFAKGAQGAASTFQGAMNNMQTSLQLFYQAFEPLAIRFLDGFVSPIANGLKTVTDGLNSFFTGAAAKTAGGFAVTKELNSLKSSFSGIRETALDLLSQFKLLAQGALQLAKTLLQIAGNPIIGFFIQLYAQALLVTTVLKGLIALPIVQAFVSFGRQVIALSASMTTLSSATVGTRVQLALLANGVNGAGLAFSAGARQATIFGVALKAAVGATVVGAIVVGLGLLVQRFIEMGQRLDDVKNKALGAAAAIRAMSQTEARTEEQKRQSGVRLLEKLSVRKGVNYRKTGTSPAVNMVPVDEREAAQLEALGVQVQRSPIPGMKGGMMPRQSIAGNIQQQQELMREAQFTQQRIRFDEQQAEQQLKNLPAIPEAAGDGEGTKGKRTPLNQILDLESQRRAEMALSDKLRRLSELIRNAKLSGNEAEAKSLENLSNALKISSKIQAAQNFINMLIEKEGEIIGKSLTEKEFTNKLEDAKIELYKLQNDLQMEFDELQVKEASAAKDAVDELAKKIEKQKELNRLIEDAQIAAGVISPQQAAIIQQQRGFEDARARIEAGGTPEQLAQLTAAQALIPEAGSIQEYIKGLREELQQLISVQNLAAVSARGIGEALGEAMTNGVASLISGTATAKEVFASFLQSVGQSLSQAASQMISTYIAIGIAKMFAGLGSFSGGAKVGEMVQMPSSVGMGAGGGIIQNSSMQGFGTFGPNFGIRQFADGGIVSGPTLSLVGEGKYNEAIVPLPNGRSIPVQFSGERSARDMMSRNAQAVAQASPINLSFETTKIGNTEYVSRDQLEAAMAETRRAAINGGAARGMSMTLDRIQQSPSVRSRIGIR